MDTITRYELQRKLSNISDILTAQSKEGSVDFASPAAGVSGMICDLVSSASEIKDDNQFYSSAVFVYASLRAWWTVVVTRIGSQSPSSRMSADLNKKADVFADALAAIEQYLGADTVDGIATFISLAGEIPNPSKYASVTAGENEYRSSANVPQSKYFMDESYGRYSCLVEAVAH